MSARGDIVVKFGAKVRELRVVRRLTQEDLAGKVGVGRAALISLEKGEGAPPRLDLIVGLADALGVGPATLLPLGPPEPPKPWEVVARRLGLSYEEALRLRALAEDAGLADVGSAQDVLLVWMHETKVLP
jgi:transcriptional regulator with XRE-family HTH domain